MEDKNMELRDRVDAALDEVREVLKRDGGNLELVDVTPEKVVKVRLQGHCIGCPGAQMTLRMVVQQILQQAVPEVTGVEAVD
ncbi:MAG: NifU family protein [Eubacterium sp.]